MGLTYHFEFTAPHETTAEKLECFLYGVEVEARRLGFQPTKVLNAEFDTRERRAFARRLTTGYAVEDARLKGANLKRDSVWDFNPETGLCRVIPERAVVLIVTDERACETIFGFMRYPEHLRDAQGQLLLTTALGGHWHFRDHLKSPDPRFRQIVELFRQAGYVEHVDDEFEPAR